MGASPSEHRRGIKIEAVKPASERARSTAEVIDAPGNSCTMLFGWKREFGGGGATAFPGNRNLSPVDEELRRVRRDLPLALQEPHIFKDAVAFFPKGRRLRFAFHGGDRPMLDVIQMSRELTASTSGFSVWLRPGDRQNARRDRRLTIFFEEFFGASHQIYSAPRFHQKLCSRRQRCGRRRVPWLMREAGLSTQMHRSADMRTTVSHHSLPLALHVLQRDFRSDVPQMRSRCGNLPWAST